MRIVIGIILGAALTIGGAYLYDSSHARANTSVAAAPRSVVNWDVVATKWEHLSARARQEWTKLARR